MRMNLITMTAPAGSLLIAVAALALVVATSAQAITPAPLHEPDGMITHVRHACGAGMHYVSGVGCVTTPASRHARRENYRYDYNYNY